MSLSILSRFVFEASILFQVDLFLRHYVVSTSLDKVIPQFLFGENFVLADDSCCSFDNHIL
ncbi:hypothetical protein Kole_0363 [Kosmotoga olearia TBF 19.5.1]|uniref:Uncharacterized protein n=1 Tax=Kosmotoga olearia (strain ATCC BAA-1733 / DSM 21960 / TBF 19.5.1) TaxID=521045 RepID=C5CDK4_KOSOT|nr:hypothetical protein Kole_0363 [Kosmotoga olearia TBF 19.5.1]